MANTYDPKTFFQGLGNNNAVNITPLSGQQGDSVTGFFSGLSTSQPVKNNPVVLTPPVQQNNTVQTVTNIFSQLGSNVSSLISKAGNFLDAVFNPPKLISPVPEEKKTPYNQGGNVGISSLNPVKTTQENEVKIDYGKVLSENVSFLNKKLGPLLFSIYTPTEYVNTDKPFSGEIKQGVEPTAGKAIGGLIEDALNAFIPVSGSTVQATRNVLKEGINIVEGIKTGAIFAGFTAFVNALKEEKIEIPDLLVSGGFGFLLGSFEPEVMKGLEESVITGAKDVLQKFGFENKDFKNPEILKSKWRNVVKELHPDKGGNAEEFKVFTDAYNKITSSGINSEWKLPDQTVWVDKLWDNLGLAKEDLLKMANDKFKVFLEKIVGKDSRIMELSPKSVQDIVIGSNLQDEPIGKLMLKNAITAQQTGKNVLIMPLDKDMKGENIAKTPQGVNVGIGITDPTENVDKISVNPVEKTIEKVGEPIIEDKEIIVSKTTEQRPEEKKISTNPQELSTMGKPGEELKPEQKPVGEGKIRESEAYRKVRDLLDETARQDVNYNRLNLEKDTENALNFIVEKPQEALRVGFGLEPPPEGQTETAVSIALADKAGRDGNHILQSQLESSRSLRQTRRGQEIVSERGRFNDESPHRYISELMDRRLKNIGKSIKSDVMETFNKINSAKQKAIDKIDKTAEALSKVVKRERNKIKLAQDVIDSLICK